MNSSWFLRESDAAKHYLERKYMGFLQRKAQTAFSTGSRIKKITFLHHYYGFGSFFKHHTLVSLPVEIIEFISFGLMY